MNLYSSGCAGLACLILAALLPVQALATDYNLSSTTFETAESRRFDDDEDDEELPPLYGSPETPQGNLQLSSVGAEGLMEPVKAGDRNAYISVENVSKVTKSAFETIVTTARQKDAEVTLFVDHVTDGEISARLYLNAEKGYAANADILTGIVAGDKKIRRLFEDHYTNPLEIVKFSQVSSFGMEIEAAVKLSFRRMDTQTLKFYSYDQDKNVFSLLPDIRYYFDKGGYLHFTTSTGGTILITDREFHDPF